MSDEVDDEADAETTPSTDTGGAVIGIDLGTTHTLVSVLTDEGPVVLRDERGEALIPSAVALDDEGTCLVGQAALERAARNPERSARWFKRDMGSDVPYALGDVRMSPTELSAVLLREARTVAELALGEAVDRAVITVPAYFQEPQRAATMEAGALAGLEVMRVLNEPTAAAMAHGLQDAETERSVAVLDLGGGTLDITLLEIYDGVIEVIATGGDARLGGEDFTDALLALAAAEAGMGDDAGWRRSLLRRECERVKRALSQADAATLPLPDPTSPMWRTARTLTVSRPAFEAACRPLLGRIRRCVSDALAAGGVAPESIDEVLLVGGATHMTSVRALASSIFGRPAAEGPDPELAVALGAAVQAGLVTRHAAVRDVVVTDVLSHSLGVETAKVGEDRLLDGYFSPVLHRNTTIPVRRVERLYTMHPKQTEVVIKVYQGEHRYTRQNRLLGEFTVGGIPPLEGEEGQQSLDVAFTHDVNGLLEVEATVTSTGETASILIEQQAGRLTDAARARALASLARLKVHPRELLPNKLLLEAALSRHARLDPKSRGWLDPALTQFEEALAREQPERIEAAAVALRAALEQVGEGA